MGKHNVILKDNEVVVKTKQEIPEERVGEPVKEIVQDKARIVDQNDLPRKEADLRVVALLVSIGNIKIGNALIDLDASLNIIPLLVV